MYFVIRIFTKKSVYAFGLAKYATAFELRIVFMKGGSSFVDAR